MEEREMVKIDKLDKYFNKGRSNENHVLKEVSLEMEERGSYVSLVKVDRARPHC